MLRTASVLAATVLAAACRSQAPSAPAAPATHDEIDIAMRERIARAEARRGGGLDELIELSRIGPPAVRALALRGLGRTGGARARVVLLAAVNDGATKVAALSAIGLHAALHEPAPEVIGELSAALARVRPETEDETVALIDAIGRAGTAELQKSVLASQLTGTTPRVREAAALALARHGRRKLELDPTVRLALLELLDDADRKVRYAAAFAFAREHIPAPTPTTPPPSQLQNVGPRLAKLVEHDDDASVRAVAAAALAKQNSVGAGHAALEKALTDTDWRVAVQAVRSLAGEHGDDAGRDAVAGMLPARLDVLVAHPERAGEAHVVIEALRVLGPHAKRPLVDTALATVARRAAQAELDRTVWSWIRCLASVAQARTAASPDLVGLMQCGLPEHLAASLVAELIRDGVGDGKERATAASRVWRSTDPRTRAAVIGVLPSLVHGNRPGFQLGDVRVTDWLIRALLDKDPIVAGAAVEVADAVAAKLRDSERKAIDIAILEAAEAASEPEIAGSLFTLIGTRKLEAGRELCRAQLDKQPAFAAAGRACLRELGEAVEVAPDPPAAELPPVPLVIEQGITWQLVFEGRSTPVTIELDAFTAPWAVSSIIHLTEQGKHHGIAVHRVVPDFVVQGGDPTASGWGGPGYTLPAEPTAEACFVEGGVGLADAGPDSAGSQWFIMHSRAPHLDARYTCVGRLNGENLVHGLQIGDRVQRAAIRRTTRGPARESVQ